MLRVILVDDEPLALELLDRMIREQTDLRVLGAYANAAKALEETERLKPDVVFLDIDMPGLNGLEFGARLLMSCPQTDIVYVTAYSEYALQAFRVNAVDYLLKPYKAGEIQRTADKLKRRHAGSEQLVRETQGGRIVCFGGFAVYAAGEREPIRFPTSKTEELLAYLLVRGRDEAGKWEICESLWPNFAAARAEQNLHTTAHRLKKTLAEHGVGIRIESRRGSYRAEIADFCDYTAFTDAVGRLAGRREDPRSGGADASAIAETLSWMGGELFAGKDYPWCEAARTATLRDYANLAKRLAGLYASNGVDGDRKAAELLRELLSHSALDEEAHFMLLRTYARLGDRVSFVAHYEQMERLLRTELGLAPRMEIQQLYQQVIGI